MRDDVVVDFPSPKGHVTVGPYRPGDEHEILRLFKLVFDVDRPLEVWNWEFRDCPEGIHSYVGRHEDGRIVSQFCGIPVRVKVRDQILCFAQMVDSMVHPDFRAGLKKKGLFATTVDAFVERYGHLDEEVIMMGLPNPPAFRIGRKLCGYVPMTKVYVHAKSVAPDVELPMPPEEVSYRMTKYRLRVVERFGADVDGLWERLAPRFEVAGVRDRRHLDWRYADCPQWDYVLVECRTAADDALQGVAVLRTRWLDAPDLMIADWLCDHERPGAAEALLDWCEHLGRKAGMERITCLLNPMCAESRFFEDRDYQLAPTQFRLVSRTYAPDVVDVPWLNRYWYYTMGDFDVV